MGGSNTQLVDVECLRESGRRRGNCLNTFLIMSIVFLFLAVTAVAVGGVMMTMALRSEMRAELRTELQSQLLSELLNSSSSAMGQTSRHVGEAGEVPPVYKAQNFAFLEAKIMELDNSTMQWLEVQYGPGTSVGSNFNFEPDRSSVTPKKSGSYFMYLDLKLKCVATCKAGVLTVQVGNVFKCEVEIPHGSTSLNKKCWTVSMLDEGVQLTAGMSVPKTHLKNWKLDKDSQFGIFLID